MGYLTSSFHPGAKYPIFSLTLFLIEDMNIDGRACVLLLSCANLLTTVYNHCNMGRLALVVNDTSLFDYFLTQFDRFFSARRLGINSGRIFTGIMKK